ncbi:MAG: succinate dehydrogenase, cytochrome b556 subunit [Rhodobacter sp.]|nr:succinate dehydrogenase, cytochrome b556 subunit [Rhodobacter sp.]
MRRHPLWLAHLLHRISGLALALFLPVHFWVLSLAIRDTDGLNRFLTFTDLPGVKLAEFGLVFLLAVHMAGGLRLMALEHLGWTTRQKSLAAGAVGVAVLISGTFFLKAI